MIRNLNIENIYRYDEMLDPVSFVDERFGKKGKLLSKKHIKSKFIRK